MNSARAGGQQAGSQQARSSGPAPSPQVPAPVLAVLVVGGVLGCLARYKVSQAWPTPAGGWPLGTFLINLSGCLGLGFLLEHLTRRGPDVGVRRLIRLGVGTGFLGTYTTYSTLAVEIDLLTDGGDVLLAVGYAVASLLAGLTLAGAGAGLVAGLDCRSRRPPPCARPGQERS